MKCSRKTLLFLFATVLSVGALVWILSGTFSQGNRFGGKREIEVALLGRAKGHFMDLHSICLQLLFDELNHRGINGGASRLVLRSFDLRTLQGNHGDTPPYEAILRENPNISVILDNTWGSDLQKSRDVILKKRIPVISLNADRTADFGSSVLFLGSQNMVPSKIASFIDQALLAKTAPTPPTEAPPLPLVPPSPPPSRPMLLFLTEEGYGLDPSQSGNPVSLYESELAKRNIPVEARISFSEQKYDNPAEQKRVTEEVLRALKEAGQREVVVVVNAHKQWGSRLVARFEEFASNNRDRSIRVIGHDSMFNQSIHDSVREASTDDESMNFEMVLMKAPNPEFSTHTFALYRNVVDTHGGGFEDYPKEVASIFVRRCAVAAELVRHSLRDFDLLDRQAEGSSWNAKSRIEKDRSLLTDQFAGLVAPFPAAPGSPRQRTGAHVELGALGLVHFNRDGEEDGSHYFELHKPGNRPIAHLKQLNARNELIPALQIGINEFQIRRVDVERGEFDAEFICSTTIDASLKKKVLLDMKSIRKEEEQEEPIPEEKSAIDDPRGRLAQYPMLSGLLSIPNMRADGSVAQIGQTDRSVADTEYRVYKVRGTFAADLNTVRYPFDSHRIGVELQAAVPDELLTLTAQRIEPTAFEENQRGWILKWIHGLVDSRVANGNPLATAGQRTETRQFKEFAIMVGVKRNLLQPILVVMLPLILLGMAAIGIMYLGEKETMGKSPSELAMGVVLAIVAYSISYADVVPRSGGGTHSDLLYLITTLMCMGNFGAVLFFGEMGNPRTRHDEVDRWRFRYALGISVFYLIFVIYWGTSSDLWPV
ncbi:MAG: hypothetical protein DVB23_000444 [Verrucomicrobia bacterium]|nr:MAG: hypothetical protein DVB23_000444 [Verrucomicrobiota bacterium]